MKYYLIFYVFFGSGGDPGIIPGYQAPSRMAQVEMPSLEICEQVRAINKFQNMECWAKMGN